MTPEQQKTTGALKELKNVEPVDSQFTVSSIHGYSKITQKCKVKIFGKSAIFFMLKSLNAFDAIIGFDLLTQLGAVSNLRDSAIKYGNVSEQLKFHQCSNVNFTRIDDILVPEMFRKDFKVMLLKRIKAFAVSH